MFDGDLCETKQEAFQKYQEKRQKHVKKRFGGAVKKLFGNFAFANNNEGDKSSTITASPRQIGSNYQDSVKGGNSPSA